MYCLWNEEYGEHDLTHIAGLKDILKLQAESYEKYRGMIVGDYEVLDVEYDWGKRDQRWKVRCIRCHKIVYQYHANDWRRGKGRKTTCNCDRDLRKALIEINKEKAAERREFNRIKQIGKVYGDWEIIEYNGYQKCTIRCTTCGKTRSCDIKYDDVVTGKITPCNHKVPNDYSGDKWIGKKEGHLTVIGRDGMMFIAKCDCGEEIRVRPTDLFTSKRIQTCSSPNCIYANKHERDSRKRHKKGFDYEYECEKKLKEQGYNAKKTQNCGDFGVDIIITEENGTKIAVQCKKQTGPAGVDAIQETYAGGRYYDCEKFAVICESGFSNNAILMARKLGVYLCNTEKFSIPDNIDDYCKSLLPVQKTIKELQKLYEIDGKKKTLGDWCLIYNISEHTVRKRLKAGITLKTALETQCKTTRGEIYTVHNYTGNIADICRHFNVSEPYVKYRMTTNKMSLEDAIFQPKKAIGRPKKSDHSKEDDKQIIIQGF